MQCLHRLGLGVQLRQAEPISESGEVTLWKAGELGKHSAQALLNCKMFGWQSPRRTLQLESRTIWEKKGGRKWKRVFAVYWLCLKD